MNKNEILRRIPKLDEVLQQQPLFDFFEEKGTGFVTDSARKVIDALREEILALSEKEVDQFDAERLMHKNVAKAIAQFIVEDDENNLIPAINATGTILHTNLGRAPLCKEAVENVMKVSKGYSNLEYDVKAGKRGSRHDIVSELIAELTGAEDAMLVNNNASATMLVLSAMAAGKECIVSRGELVEIGGAFRIPDIMVQSGATLHEVGTTNKTKISDYENAINENTGALMKVHKSNYDIVGFTEEATLEELVELGRKYDLPVIYDMGNGLMVDMQKYGVGEPNVPASLATGIDVILFSGDKLLGGPQGGIIAGRDEYIKKMKKHPLARAVRVDKMTFAAMEETLKKYKDEAIAIRDIPVLSMIAASKEDLYAKAEKLKAAVESACGKAAAKLNLEIVEVEDQIGGGSAPSVRLPGYAVAITSDENTTKSLERRLRKNDIPVVARIQYDQLLLCVRTIMDDEIEEVAKALKA